MNPLIVLPTYNAADLAECCLRSLWYCTPPGTYDLWVCDDRSRIEELLRITEAKDIYCSNGEMHARKQNLGFGGNTNLALREALDLGYEEIVLLNSDVEVSDGWLEKLRAALSLNERVGAVGPVEKSPYRGKAGGWSHQSVMMLPDWLRNDDLRLSRLEELSFEETGKLAQERWKGLYLETVTLLFFCTLLRAEALRDTGLPSERYESGHWADIAWTWEAHLAGWKNVIAADTVVRHDHHGTFEREVPAWEKAMHEGAARFARDYGVRFEGAGYPDEAKRELHRADGWPGPLWWPAFQGGGAEGATKRWLRERP